ncbi:MAG: hypothetical protein MUO24_04560 [Desulfobacterales bacterium]|nr:hypothetical protein [Desulfobacterales bacterium]
MHVVVIHGWKEETTELVQAISSALGIMVFEARQRMIGGGPAVVGSFADPQQALSLAKKLNQNKIATLVVDATAVRSGAGHFIVRRFELNESSMRIETGDRQRAEVPYGEIDLLLPSTSIVEHSETKTVTGRKLSLGKTILSGGIPMSKKVKHQEEVTTEERSKVLYLYAGNRLPIVFSQNGMIYDGLGAAMKLSRELNFTYLISELRRLSPGAVYDDRLRNRVGLVRLLGPTQSPETNLDLAAEILARSLRRGRSGSIG